MTEFITALRQRIESLLKKLEACELAYSKHWGLLRDYTFVYENELEVGKVRDYEK